MSWEKRGSQRYYYRVHRDQNGRLMKVYCGTGVTGQQTFEEDLQRRQSREQKRRERKRLQRLDANGRDVSRIVNTLAKAHLLAAEYHVHKRQWRKRRESIQLLQRGDNEGMTMTPYTIGSASPESSLEDLVKRGMQGDHEVIPAIRQLLDQCPELWQEPGNKISRAERAWLQARTGNDLVSREILSREHATIKADLLAQASTHLERLVVETLGVHRLQFLDASDRAAKHQEQYGYVTSYQEKRLANATKLLENSARTLAQVQKLLRPKAPVINVAQQQVVNVG